MGSTRRNYGERGLTREQRMLKRQRKEQDMAGIENLYYGQSYDESVHDRWDTGSPSDWRVGSFGEVYNHLSDLNAGEGRGYDRDTIYDDANLIWDWITSSRGEA